MFERIKKYKIYVLCLYGTFSVNRGYFKKTYPYLYVFFKIVAFIQKKKNRLQILIKYQLLKFGYLLRRLNFFPKGVFPLHNKFGQKNGEEMTIFYDVLSLSAGSRVCIYSYYSERPKGIESNILYALQCLKNRGYHIIFVSTSGLDQDNVMQLSGACDLIVCRSNICCDIGSVKMALSILNERNIYTNIASLLMMNSSVVVDLKQFEDLLIYCESSPEDFTGQTQNTEISLHIQSYFIYFARSCLTEVNQFFKDFSLKILSLASSKQKYIIKEGEVALSQYLLSKGKTFDTYIELSELNTFSYQFVKKYHPPLITKKMLYLDWRNVWRISYFLDIALQYQWLQDGFSVVDLGCINPKKVNLFSIVYHKESVKKPCQILKLSNLENPQAQQREYYIFQTMYNYLVSHIQSSADEYYWGFLSWKFKGKMGCSEDVFEYYIMTYPNFDVYFLNPFEKQIELYNNIFKQGEVYHPGITELTNSIVKKAGYSFDVERIAYEPDKQTFCNYFVGNKKFWDRYIQFMSPIVDVMQNCLPEEFPLLFQRVDKIIDANYTPYIIERLFSVFLHLEAGLRIMKINFMGRGASRSKKCSLVFTQKVSNR